ncbi:Capsular polysaccharide synthesis enzyme CpsE [Crocosphaera watsonii WH 0402]|uniref:Capsular polysaccharide synthesis enzyme CpsE n=1 Tax=Crocosphaera watsonii WH 0402 TaxID=1284629 RepID=T2K0B9_CROWT|nr:Capsular polysaccharide synthesis enzyme CpsE [Crocosphaera watsonii WH 0402]
MQNCLQDAFSEFLGIDNFRLSNKNQAKQKTYFEVYSDFLNSIVLPQSYIDKMYSSKYMKHFYSQNEIDKFREKWSKH